MLRAENNINITRLGGRSGTKQNLKSYSHSPRPCRRSGRRCGQPFTAKDFRTWAGTVLAAIALGKMEEVDSETMAKRNVLTAIEAVAGMLGNTVAICRKCYIHPAITASYLDGTLAGTLRVKADSQIAHHLHDLKPEEAAVLALLRQELARQLDKHRPPRRS
jgi:DNA topoisomerase I